MGLLLCPTWGQPHLSHDCVKQWKEDNPCWAVLHIPAVFTLKEVF